VRAMAASSEAVIISGMGLLAFWLVASICINEPQSQRRLRGTGLHYHDSCIAGEVTIKTTLAIRSNAFCTSEPTFQSSHGNGAEIMAEEFLAKCKQQAGISATSSELDTESLATAMPPVEQWNPSFLRRYRDADCPRGTPIARPALLRLFSTILRKGFDGYVLVTPVEETGIKVEDAPFLAVEMTGARPRPKQVLRFLTNVAEGRSF
jgi:Domain of unknown function (DUF1285), N-terminal domain